MTPRALAFFFFLLACCDLRLAACDFFPPVSWTKRFPVSALQLIQQACL